MPPTEEQLRANPRPWMTDGAVDFIERNLRPTDRVIEFGGGWSSIWWASRAAWTLTVEADHIWAAKILGEIARHPQLMTKWSMRFVGCEWSNLHTNPKGYWTKNKGVLNPEIADRLETAYMEINFAPDVVAIDGSARARNVVEVDRYLNQNQSIRMIVVDNMEWLARHTEGRFRSFQQYDFPEYDVAKIPPHQNGKWTTSVWLR
jgi:hypothetical protein